MDTGPAIAPSASSLVGRGSRSHPRSLARRETRRSPTHFERDLVVANVAITTADADRPSRRIPTTSLKSHAAHPASRSGSRIGCPDRPLPHYAGLLLRGPEAGLRAAGVRLRAGGTASPALHMIMPRNSRTLIAASSVPDSTKRHRVGVFRRGLEALRGRGRPGLARRASQMDASEEDSHERPTAGYHVRRRHSRG